MRKPSSIKKGPWLLIRAELLAGLSGDEVSGSGVLILSTPNNTFQQLHEVIERGCGREDQNHLHQFIFQEEPILISNDTLNQTEDEISENVTLGDRVDAGDTFEYLFDLGDQWRYAVGVERSGLDLGSAFRQYEHPYYLDEPILLAGWGEAPSQYAFKGG